MAGNLWTSDWVKPERERERRRKEKEVETCISVWENVYIATSVRSEIEKATDGYIEMSRIAAGRISDAAQFCSANPGAQPEPCITPHWNSLFLVSLPEGFQFFSFFYSSLLLHSHTRTFTFSWLPLRCSTLILWLLPQSNVPAHLPSLLTSHSTIFLSHLCNLFSVTSLYATCSSSPSRHPFLSVTSHCNCIGMIQDESMCSWEEVFMRQHGDPPSVCPFFLTE